MTDRVCTTTNASCLAFTDWPAGVKNANDTVYIVSEKKWKELTASIPMEKAVFIDSDDEVDLVDLTPGAAKLLHWLEDHCYIDGNSLCIKWLDEKTKASLTF